MWVVYMWVVLKTFSQGSLHFCFPSYFFLVPLHAFEDWNQRKKVDVAAVMTISGASGNSKNLLIVVVYYESINRDLICRLFTCGFESCLL